MRVCMYGQRKKMPLHPGPRDLQQVQPYCMCTRQGEVGVPRVLFLQMDSVEPMQVDDPENGSGPPPDFTVDPPNFDLEGYANSYEGLAKVRRLMFVAKHCPSLQIDALRYLSLL